MSSNSSRFRCLLRKAAARFLTKRASRLVSPVTSGGIKSFVLMHVRVRFDVEPLVVVEARFAEEEDEVAEADATLALEVPCVDSANPSEDVGDVGGGVGSDERAGSDRPAWAWRSGRKLKLKSKESLQLPVLRVTGLGVTSARKCCIDRRLSISYSDSDDDGDDGDADCGNIIDPEDEVEDSDDTGDTGEMGYWG